MPLAAEKPGTLMMAHDRDSFAGPLLHRAAHVAKPYMTEEFGDLLLRFVKVRQLPQAMALL
jgi:hypothetical protein